MIANHVTVDDQLPKFWEIEETSLVRQLTQEKNKCEEFYEKTVSRDVNGRIHVRIPMKYDDIVVNRRICCAMTTPNRAKV